MSGKSEKEYKTKNNKYIKNEDGFYVNIKTGEVLAHEEECVEAYQRLSKLFCVFNEIEI